MGDNGGESTLRYVLKEVAGILIAVGVTIWAKYVIIDPMVASMSGAASEEQLDKKKKELDEKLNRPEIIGMYFDTFEYQIMTDILCPADINTTFEDIGGMESELEMIKENICIPMHLARNFRDIQHIANVPSGVLLYGPPGTGKTLSAKAIAKESGATFIEIKASSLMSKWFGETNKLICSLFNIAKKLSPSVIFIDEIDTILGNRGQDHPGYATMLGHILSEWDGLGNNNEPVLVLGTTNRPSDLDHAFLRRLPLQIKTTKPDENARADILKRMLKSQKIADDVDISELARKTEEYSGSDLNELVRLSTVKRAKEIVLAARNVMSKEPNETVYKKRSDVLPTVRPLTMSDFTGALNQSCHTGGDALSYTEAQLLQQAQQKKDMFDRVTRKLAGNADLH